MSSVFLSPLIVHRPPLKADRLSLYRRCSPYVSVSTTVTFRVLSTKNSIAKSLVLAQTGFVTNRYRPSNRPKTRRTPRALATVAPTPTRVVKREVVDGYHYGWSGDGYLVEMWQVEPELGGTQQLTSGR